MFLMMCLLALEPVDVCSGVENGSHSSLLFQEPSRFEVWDCCVSVFLVAVFCMAWKSGWRCSCSLSQVGEVEGLRSSNWCSLCSDFCENTNLLPVLGKVRQGHFIGRQFCTHLLL